MVQITWRNSITTPGILDKTISLNPQIPQSKKNRRLRLIAGSIPKLIPNIYSYGGENTRTLYLSNDGFGSSNELLTLPEGEYSIVQLEAALINAMITLGWITSTSFADSPIQIAYNLTNEFVYMTLDSTKLLVGTQIGINLSSDIKTLLGYSSVSSFNTDGVKYADKSPRVDYQGSYFDVRCTLIPPLQSIVESENTSVLFTFNINAVSSSLINEYFFPYTSIRMPWLEIGNISISSYTINITRTDGKSVYFLYGSSMITMDVEDY